MRPTKHTKEKVLEELRSLVSLLKTNTDILSVNSLILERQKAIFDKERYSPRMFYYWKSTFFDDEEVFEYFDLIEKILEDRVAIRCLEGRLSGNFGKFYMTNKHGWKEKAEVENHHTGALALHELAAEAERDEEESSENEKK